MFSLCVCICSLSKSLEQRQPGALQRRERPKCPCARGRAEDPRGSAGSGPGAGTAPGWIPPAPLRARSRRCRWQPCLPSSSFPASSQPPNKGLRRCVRSSSLFNSSNCHVEEREGGRLLLSARLSQSKIPAEQLKIDGQLVVRAGSSPESMASVSQECCLVIRPDKLGLALVCVCVRDRLQWGRGAALDVSEAGVLVSSGVCRESIAR